MTLNRLSLSLYKIMVLYCSFLGISCTGQEQHTLEQFLHTTEMKAIAPCMTEAQREACLHKAETLYAQLKATSMAEDDIVIAIEHEILKEYYILVEQKKSDLLLHVQYALPPFIVVGLIKLWKA